MKTLIDVALCVAVVSVLSCGSDDTSPSGAGDMSDPGSTNANGAQASNDGGCLSDSGSRGLPDAAPLGPSPLADGGACPDLGWCDLANTKLASVCPDATKFNLGGSCGGVISAWGSGLTDLPRDRLLFWGGGHSDYNGNEIYSLNLNDLTLTRLNDPSPPADCAETLSDGRPAARHTYDGLSFMEDLGLVYMYGGATACTNADGTTAWLSQATWTLDPSSLAWTRKDPTSGGPAQNPDCCDYISASDYDPDTHAVYMVEESNVWRYDSGSNAYMLLNTGNGIDYHETAVVDRAHHLLLVFGGGQVWAINLAAGSDYSPQDWSAQVTGCDALAGAGYPAVAFDSSQNLVVGWAGGGTVYTFDATTKACTSHSFSGGPGDAQENGTGGRFRYFPNLNVFALVNDWQQDAFVLRLTP